MSINNELIRRGNILMADLGHPIGDELGYRRPVLVIQNDNYIGNSSTVLVAIISGKTLPSNPETHVELMNKSNGRIMTIMLEHLRAIDKSRIVRYCATLCDDGINAVNNALRIITGIEENE